MLFKLALREATHFTYKSRGPGWARPGPSQGSRLWPGLGFEKAKAASGQAKAGALRPSRAGTALLDADPLKPPNLDEDLDGPELR
jgi:hypothetical protein